jgi:macrodomain Ter protein organizer (MatP/YcbG family)
MKRADLVPERPHTKSSITIDLGNDLHDRLRQISLRHKERMSNIVYDMIEHAVRRAEDH